MFVRIASLALIVLPLIVGCQSEEMKKCLKMCDEVAGGKANECTGPNIEDCKKEIAAADAECRLACKELIEDAPPATASATSSAAK